jgi:CRISPR-associated protein Cas5t
VIGLKLSVPVACFRRPFAREYWETEVLPPPSTCYGFLLSLVGERDRRRHIGVRVCPALLSRPEKSKVLRTLRRVKELSVTEDCNARPDFQELLTGIELALWLDSGEETGATPTLEGRVRLALEDPGSIERSGGLSLGESTHLVDSVDPLREGEIPGARAFLLADQGRLSLAVWADHLSLAKTRYCTGDLVELDSPPPIARCPKIQGPPGGTAAQADFFS